jgi:hypothetical protein
MTTFGGFSRQFLPNGSDAGLTDESGLSARSGVTIDVRVFEHARYEGFWLEERFLLDE